MKYIIWLIVAVAVAGAGIGWWMAGTSRRHLAEAEHLVAHGRGAESRGWLASPEADPKTRDRALLLRARIAVEAGRPGDAIRPLDQIDPDGRWGDEAAFWRGRTLQALHEPRDAIAWLQKAWKARPNDAEIPRWIAVAAYDLGARQTALDALKAAAKLEPEDAKAWRTMGLIYKEKAQFGAALAAYDAALKIDRAQPAVRFERADTLANLGRYADAEAALKATRGGASAADRAALLARCQIGKGDLDAASRTLDAALVAAPNHPELLGERATIDRSQGHFDDMVHRLDQAIKADPYTPEWHYQRGLALRSLRRSAEAEEALARARGLQAALTRLSQLDNEAAQRPDDAEVREQLGDLWQQLGKEELAASWYVAALSCDPGRASARRSLRTLNARLGDRALITSSTPR